MISSNPFSFRTINVLFAQAIRCNGHPVSYGLVMFDKIKRTTSIIDIQVVTSLFRSELPALLDEAPERRRRSSERASLVHSWLSCDMCRGLRGRGHRDGEEQI